jgi:threonine/homoserine/homoserine lactone efflux protein
MDGIASSVGTAIGGMVHVAVAAVGLSALRWPTLDKIRDG